jgi:hypothetical protein
MEFLRSLRIAWPATWAGRIGAPIVVLSLLNETFGSTLVLAGWLDAIFQSYTALGGLVLMAGGGINMGAALALVVVFSAGVLVGLIAADRRGSQ